MTQDGGETYRVVAPVTRVAEGRDTYYFATIGGEAADRIRFDALGLGLGLRRKKTVRIIATIDDIIWSTFLFTSGEQWLLSLKLEVRRRAGLSEGDRCVVTVRLGAHEVDVPPSR